MWSKKRLNASDVQVVDYTPLQLSLYPIFGNCQMLPELFIYLYITYFIAKIELTHRAANRIICLTSVLQHKHTRLSAGSKSYYEVLYGSITTETSKRASTTSR